MHNQPLLSSKNYSCVFVTVRDMDGPITMKPQAGMRLMDYLTGNDAGSHVQLTAEKGAIIVVRTTDILKVEPVEKMKEVADYV